MKSCTKIKCLISFLVAWFFSGIIVSGQTATDSIPIDFQLIIATYKGDSGTVAQLLGKGANPNAKTADSITPLMYAAEQGNISIIKLLLAYGANPDIQALDGSTALISAAKFGWFECGNLLAIHNCNLDIRDNRGLSALMYAAYYADYLFTDMLLFYGANPNIKANDSATALHLAAFMGDTGVVRLLLKNHADVDARNIFGNTPLILAIQQGNIAVASLLVQYGANVNVTNFWNISPLALGIFTNQNTIDFLLKNKADVNQKLNYNYSPYKLALHLKNYHLAKMLKKSGALQTWKPFIDNYFISTSIKISPTDHFASTGFGICESRYNLKLGLLYETRFTRKSILYPFNDTLYYQFREFRQGFSLQLQKHFQITRNKNSQSGVYGALSGYFGCGSYKATDIKPDNIFSIPAEFGYYLHKKDIFFELGYQYLETKIHKTFPHFIHFTFGFYIHRPAPKYSPQKYEWIN